MSPVNLAHARKRPHESRQLLHPPLAPHSPINQAIAPATSHSSLVPPSQVTKLESLWFVGNSRATVVPYAGRTDRRHIPRQANFLLVSREIDRRAAAAIAIAGRPGSSSPRCFGPSPPNLSKRVGYKM